MKFDICPDVVFEASWEITNKCGGIHTVVTSKIELMQANYPSYYLIGPLFNDLPEDFEQQTPPEHFTKAFSALEREGIRCVFGTWNVAGKPSTILLDARALYGQLNSIKGLLWEKFQIDSLHASGDFHEPLLWAWGVGKLIEELRHAFDENHGIVAHFHEWLAGFGLLYLRHVQSTIATVFTTHATMLGRTIAGNTQQLYEHLDEFVAEDEAKRYNILEKHTTERACALYSHAYTTVSDITAKECTAFFGRTPDLLPNGLAIDSFPTFDEANALHAVHKEHLRSYVMTHFFPYYTFDLEKTLFLYYGGRYEYKNKGLDIIIESLAEINKKLKDEQSEQTIVMFFFVAWNAGMPKSELLENKKYITELSQTLHEQAQPFLQRVLLSTLLQEKTPLEILPQEFIEKLRGDYHFVQRQGLPLLCTHAIDEGNDPTLQHLQRVGLTNSKSDRVKVVFMPAYLEGKDPLVDLTYYQAVSGSDLGLFPSYYEPWGYTPLESVAFGTPAITSSTAGFGKYIEEEVVNAKHGLRVLDRSRADTAVTAELLAYLEEFISFTPEEHVARKRNAHALSTYADWRQLIKHYLQVHCKALHAVGETK